MRRVDVFSRARRGRRARPHLPPAVGWAVVFLALFAVAGLWLRDSSLVSVDKVTVTGLTGPDAARVSEQLEAAARDMTTLHVRTDQLRAVVENYPIVKSVRADADFPHTLRITVVENTPVAAVVADGGRIAVSGDGRLLRGAPAAGLPSVPVRIAPGGDRVADRVALEAIAALAAAPQPLRARVLTATTTRDGGLTLDLRNGPDLRFGGADRLRAKWAAAAAVLADAGSAGATYLDLRYPERPAAGGLEDPATQRDPETADAATLASSTTPASGTTP